MAPLSVDGAQKLIERLGEAAKLPFPIHVHMLRHAAGYALAARGVDTRTLQAFMGHRSIANTVVYTAVADKRIRNARRIEDVLSSLNPAFASPTSFALMEG
jgi:site-specific recombinase XerD